MSQIDVDTKIIGRFHKLASGRGLNIYNPFFKEANINALYLLFYNEDPKKLIDGFRNLNLTGAITAGFESDTVMPTLLDGLDDTAKFVGKIGYITSKNGALVGHTQGGEGMLRTIKSLGDIENKRLTIVGAGNIAKGLLFEMEKVGIKVEVSLFNRDSNKSDMLKDRFSSVVSSKSLNDVSSAEGDYFINLTDIGGSVHDYTFDKGIVSRFNGIVDITFETEQTELIKSAKEMNKKVATGWDMFTYQGQTCLEGLLDIKVDPIMLKKHVVAGLSEIVT